MTSQGFCGMFWNLFAVTNKKRKLNNGEHTNTSSQGQYRVCSASKS